MQAKGMLLVLAFLSVVVTSGGASLDGGSGGDAVVERLEREARRDERGADAEAAKAEQLEARLGETGLATKYAKLEQEIDTKGGKSMSRAHGTTPGDDQAQVVKPRDLITEAELEGGCLGECQGACISACEAKGNEAGAIMSEELLMKCERKCEKVCTKKCKKLEGQPLHGDPREARLQMKERAAAARESAERHTPRARWSWEQRMEDGEGQGKQASAFAAPVYSKPMDQACKKECMRTCNSKCSKKSATPQKCPEQCTVQCEDDCYIVEDGSAPDADVVPPGTGEEGLGDSPKQLMQRCMGECHEQCLPPCQARGHGASGRLQSRRQTEIEIHLNCSQTCRGVCLTDCRPLVETRIEAIRQDYRNRHHPFYGKEEPRPAGSERAPRTRAMQPSADVQLQRALHSGFGDFGFAPSRLSGGTHSRGATGSSFRGGARPGGSRRPRRERAEEVDAPTTRGRGGDSPRGQKNAQGSGDALGSINEDQIYVEKISGGSGVATQPALVLALVVMAVVVVVGSRILRSMFSCFAESEKKRPGAAGGALYRRVPVEMPERRVAESAERLERERLQRRAI